MPEPRCPHGFTQGCTTCHMEDIEGQIEDLKTEKEMMREIIADGRDEIIKLRDAAKILLTIADADTNGRTGLTMDNKPCWCIRCKALQERAARIEAARKMIEA